MHNVAMFEGFIPFQMVILIREDLVNTKINPYKPNKCGDIMRYIYIYIYFIYNYNVGKPKP